MKTQLLILIFLSINSFAQNIIRVKSGESIQNIIDNVNTPPGSVLMLDPGNYAGFKVVKRITIIGAGATNGINTSTITGNISFESNNLFSSDFSILMGCNVSVCLVYTDNITIRNNRFYNNGTGILISGNNCQASQNFIDLWFQIQDVNNFDIQNNIILGKLECNSLYAGISGKIINNTIGGKLDYCNPIDFPKGYPKNVQISNNILYTKNECDNRNGNQNYNTSEYQKFNNNIVRQGNYNTTDPSNKNLTDFSQVFENKGGLESTYLLSQNSPAKGAGEGGTDCGAFGGPDPYVIGGSPLGPVIEDIVVPNTVRQNDTIKIKLKARIQN